MRYDRESEIDLSCSVLIGTSLYQSSILLLTPLPKIEPIQQSNYVQTETLGKQSELRICFFLIRLSFT